MENNTQEILQFDFGIRIKGTKESITESIIDFKNKWIIDGNRCKELLAQFEKKTEFDQHVKRAKELKKELSELGINLGFNVEII